MRSALSHALRTAATFAAGLAVAGSAHAADATLRLQGQLVSSSASATSLGDDFGSGPGGYLGVEFRLNARLGIEVGAAWFELEESGRPDFTILTTRIDAALTVTPITVALDVHLTPQKRYDFYLAPKIGWAFVDDLELNTHFDFGGLPFPDFPGLSIIPGLPDQITTTLATKDQFVYGLRLGFDVPFGDSSWSFSSSIDYTAVDLELDSPVGTAPSLGLDPLSIGAGVAYSF